MAQPRGLFANRKTSPPQVASPWVPDRKASPKAILCVLPRRLRANPLKLLLKGYDLSVATSRTATLRSVRREAHDLYVVYAPLGWAEAPEVCRALRASDTTTPLIVYATQRSAAERREVLAAGAQAYVTASDAAKNLSGTAGQFIMLAELRSMEVLTAGAKAMQDDIVGRIAKLVGRAKNDRIALQKAHDRLKLQIRRLYASAGGSRANFERIWPSIYESALKRIPQSGA